MLGTPDRPRLLVFRSLRAIYAHLVDDTNHRTILTVSSLSKDLRTDIKKADSKVEVAKLVGKALGEKAKTLKIETVVFDRSGYLYHGRVKALADAAREAGLKF
jgi:large subunit ribosomal protein L18